MSLERSKRITVLVGECGGRLSIRAFRIRVTDVLEPLGAGATVEEILKDYPHLESEDNLASIDHAVLQS